MKSSSLRDKLQAKLNTSKEFSNIFNTAKNYWNEDFSNVVCCSNNRNILDEDREVPINTNNIQMDVDISENNNNIEVALVSDKFNNINIISAKTTPKSPFNVVYDPSKTNNTDNTDNTNKTNNSNKSNAAIYTNSQQIPLFTPMTTHSINSNISFSNVNNNTNISYSIQNIPNANNANLISNNKKIVWTDKETSRLINLCTSELKQKWKKIADIIGTKTASQCNYQYKVLKREGKIKDNISSDIMNDSTVVDYFKKKYNLQQNFSLDKQIDLSKLKRRRNKNKAGKELVNFNNNMRNMNNIIGSSSKISLKVRSRRSSKGNSNKSSNKSGGLLMNNDTNNSNNIFNHPLKDTNNNLFSEFLISHNLEANNNYNNNNDNEMFFYNTDNNFLFEHTTNNFYPNPNPNPITNTNNNNTITNTTNINPINTNNLNILPLKNSQLTVFGNYLNIESGNIIPNLIQRNHTYNEIHFPTEEISDNLYNNLDSSFNRIYHQAFDPSSPSNIFNQFENDENKVTNENLFVKSRSLKTHPHFEINKYVEIISKLNQIAAETKCYRTAYIATYIQKMALTELITKKKEL